MSKEFIKLSEVPVVESVSENAHALVEDNGQIVRTAASIGKSENVYFYGEYGYYTLYSDPEHTIPMAGEGLLETCLNEKVILAYQYSDVTRYYPCCCVADHGGMVEVTFTTGYGALGYTVYK